MQLLGRLRASSVGRLLLTPVGRRVPIRRGKGAPHGVALLTVMMALALLSSVVTDLGTNEMIRYRLAANERDSVKAQALAESGTHLARLLLAMQSAIQPCITQMASYGIPLPAHTFWQLVPLESDLLKGLIGGELQTSLGLDVSRSVEERKAKLAEKMAERQGAFDPGAQGAARAPFEPPEAGFGAFDGSFGVEIVDEEQKAASLRGWTQVLTPQQRWVFAQRLYNLFQPERYDFLFEDRDAWGNRTDRAELVAAIFDWIDDNQDATDPRSDMTAFGRSSAGAEDALYSSGYKTMPKNAYVDSPGELRLIRGMSDAHLRAFGDAISIYGEAKINILSAPRQTIEALVYACAQPNEPLVVNALWIQETLDLWDQWKQLGPLGGGGPATAEGFVMFLDTRGLIAVPECKDQIATESRNFTVRATGNVGEVTRVVTTVLRVYGTTEELYFYAVR